MITKERAIELLNSMGNTADEVAAFLKEKGIKGNRAAAGSCPVAVYMRSQGGDATAAVFGRYGNQEYSVHVPDPVYAFIVAFDSGVYPELVEP